MDIVREKVPVEVETGEEGGGDDTVEARKDLKQTRENLDEGEGNAVQWIEES